MKNITLQYKDLLEGKMAKEAFMRNVRMQFPQWISPGNNLTDAVNILKGKRILSENITEENIVDEKELIKHIKTILPKVYQSNPEHNAKAMIQWYKAGALKKGEVFDYLEKHLGKSSKVDENTVNEEAEKTYYLINHGEVVDSVEASDQTAAENYFYNEFEGMMSGWTVSDTHPDSLYETEELEEALDKKGIEALRKGALREAYRDLNDNLTIVKNCINLGKSNPSKWRDLVSAALKIQQEYSNTKDESSLDEAVENLLDEYNPPKSVIPYETTKGSLREVKKKPSVGLTKKQKSTIAKKAVSEGEETSSKVGKWRIVSADKRIPLTGEFYNTEEEAKVAAQKLGQVRAAGIKIIQIKDTAPTYKPGMSNPFNKKNWKESVNEAVEKPEGSYKKVTGKEQYTIFQEIDRVNPYELKRGIQIEMGMQYDPTPNYFTDKFNPEALTKATKKVLANLQKDPAYYTNQISHEFEKKSGLHQKPKEVKTGPDGAIKVKGFTDAKENVQTTQSKKERAKGNPEGVKEMKPSKKSTGGIKTMKSNGKLPKGVELMKEGFQGQFYAPEYLEQKYGVDTAKKIEAEIEEMDPNAWDRFTGMESAQEVEAYIADIKDMLSLKEGFQVGDRVKIKPEYGGGKGTVEDIKGSFVVLDNQKSYHESDLIPAGKEPLKGVDLGKSFDKFKKLKEYLKKKLKEELFEKVDQADIAAAQKTGDTLNIPASDTSTIEKAKQAKVTYTTYK